MLSFRSVLEQTSSSSRVLEHTCAALPLTLSHVTFIQNIGGESVVESARSYDAQGIPRHAPKMPHKGSRTDSKWVLQCLEPTELLRKPPNSHRKRIASAPPKFTQDPSTLRPA
eukprot:sb/3477010/